MELAPYGDLSQFRSFSGNNSNMKLIRTLFHQLVAGVEYLHCNEMAHLDLKLDNILVGEEFKLKISDFDLSFMKGDTDVKGKGTVGYRAPEVIDDNVEDPFAADIYSLGIMLFTFVVGSLPYLEDRKVNGYDLFDMLKNEDPSYWNVYRDMCGLDLENEEFDSFKRLFQLMVKKDPVERATICEIKRSKWFKGPVLSEKEYTEEMAKHYKTVLNEKH